MKRSHVAIIAVVLVVVIAGGITGGLLLTESDSSKAEPTAHYTYPQTALDNILNSCGKRLARKTCLCVVAAYESTMPYATFQAVALQGITPRTRALVQTFQAKSAACPR